MRSWVIGLAFMFLAVPVFCATASRCTFEMARFVEERLSHVENWEDFSALYSRYGHCDRPALSDAFTQAIAALAQDPQALSDLALAVRHNAALRQVVLRHLASESIPADQAERIRDAVTRRCPQHEKKLCKALLKALDSAVVK